MAQRDLDVVIGARTDAASFKRAEQKTAGFMKQIAGRGDGGVVAQAAALHHSLQRIGAAGEMAKTAMAGMDGILKGAAGDTEGMVESFKQLGFGIGEVVARLDTLADTISNRIYGVTQEMLDDEQKRAEEHENLKRLQNQQADAAEKARDATKEMLRQQSQELELLEASSEADKRRIESNRRLSEAQAKAIDLMGKHSELHLAAHGETAKSLAEQIILNADAIEKKRQEIDAAKELKEIQDKINAAMLTEGSEARLFGLEGAEREIELIKLRTEARERELAVMLDQAKTDEQRQQIEAILRGVRQRAQVEIAGVEDDTPDIRRAAIQLPAITAGAQLGGFAQAAMAGGEFRVEERRIATATRDNTKETVDVLRQLLDATRSTGYSPILN